MLIIFLSFSAFFEVFFYSIISVGLIYSLAVNFSAGILISDKSLPNFNVMDFFNPVYTMQWMLYVHRPLIGHYPWTIRQEY